jgi:tight adherence protein B
MGDAMMTAYSPLIVGLAADDMLLMALLIVGPMLAAFGVFQLVADLRSAPRRKIVDRLQGLGGRRTAAGEKAIAWEDLRKQTREVEGFLAQNIAKLRVTSRLQTIVEQANLRWTASQVLVNLTVAASIALAGLTLLGVPLLAGIGVAAAVYVLPLFYLIHRRRQRLAKMVQQLPDVFELLSQALRAGHSLASGMQLVANELPDPAGTEFARVFQEQNLGLKIEDALANLAERMDMLDVRFFVTAVLIQRQTGGDLAEVLDKISSVIRERIKLHGTVKALTAEGRLSGYVLLALPVVVFAAMLKINYEYAMVLVNHPTGQMMAMFAIVMQLMGWMMIKKIVNIKI